MDTTTTAENVTVTAPSGDDLRRLGALRPGVPVLSLHLHLDPREFAVQPARASAVTSLLDEAHKRIENHATDHDGKVSLRADLERARTFLDDYRPTRGRGLAIFSAAKANLFEAYMLPRPAHTRVTVDDSPYVTPLFAALDERDWLIVLVDAKHARFLRGNSERIEEFEHLREHVAGQHERQSTSDHQRWVEHQIDDNLKQAAAEVERQIARHGLERIIVGGPPEIVPRFTEQHLGRPLREKLAGHFAVEVPDTIPADVLTAAADCFDEDERRHERAVLDRLAEGLGRGERAAAGLVDVRAMLEQARVETLLYEQTPAQPDDGALEFAIEHALEQSAEVLPLRHHPGELEPHGGIAAVLRF